MLKLNPGDPLSASIRDFAKEYGIKGAVLSGLGAVRDAELAWFDAEKKKYETRRFPETQELVSLAGNLGLKEGDPALHAHAVCAGKDLKAVAGHLVEAVCAVTVEICVIETGFDIIRKLDPLFGLWLIEA